MVKRFYSRKANRSPNHDYSASGYYHVTICTYHRVMLFGNIKGGRMYLNAWGEMAKKRWVEIPDHFIGVDIDQYIIMPNHVHGIIIINPVGTGHALSVQELDIGIGNWEFGIGNGVMVLIMPMK